MKDKLKGKFQRGDVVDVHLLLTNDTYIYRGIVISATKRHGLYVSTRSSGRTVDPSDTECVKVKLVERRGRKVFSKLFSWSQEFA